METLATLLKYCTRQAKINKEDYFDPRYAKQEEIALYHKECRIRTKQRAACFTTFAARIASADSEVLLPGHYDRLEILPSGEPEYTAGQYPALEIYLALFNYLKTTQTV